MVRRTDHRSLTGLLNFKNTQGQLARWLEVLSQYNMTVTHRPGKKHGNADPLPRIPRNKPCLDMNVDIDPTCIHCGGCRYSVRAHRNWFNFTHDVGAVIPLNRKKHDALTEIFAALITLFKENQGLTNDFCHSCKNISFTEEDVAIITETCAGQYLHVCSTTCEKFHWLSVSQATKNCHARVQQIQIRSCNLPSYG